MEKERIVVTGMGAVTPLGIGVSDYWSNLIQGKSSVSFIEQFESSNLPVKIGAQVKNFTPTDFLKRKLVRQTDVFMQFALVAAQEALAQSKPTATPDRIGIVVGTAVGGITTITESQEQMTQTGSHRVSPHLIPKFLGNIAAAQIAIEHGIKGPSLTVNTACSSGADAVGMAVTLLKANQADVVVVVGAESVYSNLMNAALSAAKALSTEEDEPSKASRPFDESRDGFVMGEGGGAIVLERLGSAQSRDVEVISELIGYATCTDAYHVTSPDPSGEGQVRCMNNALADAGLTSADIDYINAHGTSTKIGDVIETESIKAVFGHEQAKNIAISSTKGATGHLMGAGGVTELIACIQAINEGIVPPTINYENVDPACDLDYVPNEARKMEVNIAMSNSFGFGGQNATLIVSNFKG